MDHQDIGHRSGGAAEPSREPAEPARTRTIGGARRAAITGLLSIGLLVVGGVAVANAADPSASPAPTTESTPDASNGAQDGTRDRADCPKEDATHDSATS